jgi:hypothetical protein
MSFALEYRKKQFLDPPQSTGRRRSAGERRGRTGLAAARAGTRASRATVLRALLLAAAILAVFNSAGLRVVAGDLAETGPGESLLVLCERWDDAMERTGAKTVTVRLRDLVTAAQDASWTDMAGLVGLGAPVVALKRDHDREPTPYTGALPVAAKHALDLEDFTHSGAAGQ